MAAKLRYFIALITLVAIGLTFRSFKRYYEPIIESINDYTSPTALHTSTLRMFNKVCRFVDDREHWITVFIHGNFNTGLGLLSFRNIINDSLDGSTYEKVSQAIRKDPFFYQEQPILELGLKPISPSFFPAPTTGYRFAVHPIMSGYNQVLEHVKPRREINHYYTFGWSGLWSKTIRQKEGLRFYNSLAQERARLKAQGISPKIRIIAHSHGGNVSISLAAINEARKRIEGLSVVQKEPLPLETEEYLEACKSLLLEQKKATSVANYEQYPSGEPLKIHQLVMLGTPIQSETAHLVYLDTFKNVYSLYSDEDLIQILDWVSTKSWRSSRRFAALRPPSKHGTHVMQARIRIDHDLKAEQQAQQDTSWIGKIKRAFQTKKEPFHKDFWFLGWNKEYSQEAFPLKPLPLVVFAEFIIATLDKKPENCDADINLCLQSDALKATVTKYQELEPLITEEISADLIEDIKTKTIPWRPEGLSRRNMFDRLEQSLR
jgi:hypothetical protein